MTLRRSLLDQDARWIVPDTGKPTAEFYDYAKTLDSTVRTLDATVRNHTLGPLPNVANELPATLSAAGIQMGSLYTITGSSAVRVRIA